MDKQVDVSVATSAVVVSAAAAAPINIIADEVIRPGCSILRKLLTKDNPSVEAATVTSAVDLKVNLLEGLGDDFFQKEAVDEDTIARIIAEIVPQNGDDGNETAISLVASREPKIDRNEVPISTEEKSEMDTQWGDDILTATAVLSPAPSLPPSPQPHFSQASSISTPSNSEILTEMEDHRLSPVLSGGKRKKFRRSGKGKKMFKPSPEEGGSLVLSQLFSQPEHKVLVRNYQNLISQVEEQRLQFEEMRRESEKRLTSLTSRREEAEARQKQNRNYLRRLLQQFEKLQRAIVRQRTKCREDDDLVRSLLQEEGDVRTEQESHQKELFKYEGRLLALRAVAEYPT